MEELREDQEKYLGIVFELVKSYFSWNGSDRRLTDKDWTETDDLMILILRIYFTDIFEFRKNTMWSKLLSAVLCISKQVKANTCK